MNDLKEIINKLDDELQYCSDIMIMSDNSVLLLPLLRQYIHKNISKEELIYEIHKIVPLYWFS